MTLAVQGSQSLDELERMVGGSLSHPTPSAAHPSHLTQVVATGFGEIEGADGGSAADGALTAAAAVVEGKRVRTDVPRFTYGEGNAFDAGGDAATGPGLEGGVTGVIRWVVPVNDRREVSLVFPLDGTADQEG